MVGTCGVRPLPQKRPTFATFVRTLLYTVGHDRGGMFKVLQLKRNTKKWINKEKINANETVWKWLVSDWKKIILELFIS